MPKLYVGLDVSHKTTAICALDDSGKIALHTSVATTPKAIAAALRPHKRAIARVGQESGTLAEWLHKELTLLGFPMVCLDARHTYSALAAQTNKTDPNDARGIARLLRRGMFTVAHVKSDQCIRMRALLTARRILLRKAQDLRSSVLMISKSFGKHCEVGSRTSARSRRQNEHELPPLLTTALTRASDQLTVEVKALDKLVKEMVDEDFVCRKLMKVPGVGPITALTFRAAIDDPTRFKSSRDVGAYFGLTPRTYQSGQVSFTNHISHRGNRSTRAALYVAANALLCTSTSKWSVRLWGLHLKKKKGNKIAVVACARKLAVVMHRIWVTGEEFDPKRGATRQAAKTLQ
jgi:transposase